MSVKEIKELEDEVREISVEDVVQGDDTWEEKDFVGDEEEKDEETEEEEFSIGDTMLARGDAVETWSNRESLEDNLDWEEFDDFDEEFDDEGFDYEAMGQSGDGDLYGAGAGGFDYGSVGQGSDFYGASGKSGGDLYGVGGGDGLVGSYNTGGGAQNTESSLYEVAGTGKGKKNSLVTYDAGGGVKKKGGRRGKKSGLESGVVGVKKGRSRRVSF